MTPDQMIAVIQAHKEGKDIEVKREYEGSNFWCLTTHPTWDFTTFDYRIKPEPRKPREWWAVYCDKHRGPLRGSLEDARHDRDWKSEPIVHVREVLPEEE